jgi:hypothetical protein
MPQEHSEEQAARPPSLDEVRDLIARAMRRGHFFVGPRTSGFSSGTEEVPWEVFRGRLLDPAHTRQRRAFEVWEVSFPPRYEVGTVLAVKLDAPARQVHVVRWLHCYAWEGYDAGGNVIHSRETKKHVCELVGTINLDEFTSHAELLDELAGLLFQAVVGVSRLPLTSVEAPLPAYTFGEFGYFYRPGVAKGTFPIRSYRELTEVLVAEPRPDPDLAKLLELVLRAVPADELSFVCDLVVKSSSAESAPRLYRALRTLFNDVSLSPFTDLAEKSLAFARRLSGEFGPATEFADFLGHLLRQTGRHLTAYDLVRFHHAGANYPDALLLDLVLRSYLDHIEEVPALFLDAAADSDAVRKGKRLRRRGLRQAWLIRERYRGHHVPDAPTSPGENARVLPAPYVRVPEEQIIHPHRRTKQLFLDELPVGEGSTARAVLEQSIRDLQHPHELPELGMALYLDRPLGAFKAPGEPDQTPLLSYPAFSRSIAMERLRWLGRDSSLLPKTELGALQQWLQALPVPGIPVAELRNTSRPGVVSLADAAKAAGDFVVLRSTADSLNPFRACFDFASLAERFDMTELTDGSWLVLGEPVEATEEIIVTFREPGSLRKRLELSANPREGYTVRAGVELPRSGLRVRRVWEDKGEELVEHKLTGEELVLRPPWSTRP